MLPHPDLLKAGIINQHILEDVESVVREGVTTKWLNDWIERYIRAAGGIPTFLNYNGFPAAACISVNDEVVHGIPGNRVLKALDIVTIDIGTRVGEWCVDSAITTLTKTRQSYLIDALNAYTVICSCKSLLQKMVEVVKPGISLLEIAEVGDASGLNIFPQFCGHAIGKAPHLDPCIFHTTKNVDPLAIHNMKHTFLRPGDIICLEPIITMGLTDTYVKEDGWTHVTKDGSISAHFEHTLFITEDGCQIIC